MSTLGTPPATPTPPAPGAAPPPATPPAPTPPAAPAPPAGEAVDWRASLPDDLKNEESLKVIHDIPGLAKSFIHAQKLVGADKVARPNQHWADEDHQRFYDSIGRPILEKYEITPPKDSKFVDPEWLKELKPIAHKAGVMPKQLEPVLGWFEQKMSKANEDIEAAKVTEVKQGLEGLKKEWGQAYDQKLSYAHSVLKEHASPELFALLNTTPQLGDNPHVIKLLNAIGEKFYKEDNLPDGGGNPNGKLSPGEAQIKVNGIYADPEHPYHKSEHPNHKAAIAEVQLLNDMVYPQE